MFDWKCFSDVIAPPVSMLTVSLTAPRNTGLDNLTALHLIVRHQP